MCELLGMSFNLPVRPNISFRGFRYSGGKNPHGWGLAYYPDEAPQVIKEPKHSMKSSLSAFLQNYEGVKSRIFIAHVRTSSIGEESYKNTHPFFRELNGKGYVFAHNGTIERYDYLELGRFKPLGDTDSEYIFCHLLECIRKEGVSTWKEDSFEWLSRKLSEINDYGTLNCLFSDGKFLFCYHDKSGYASLCFVHRKAPYEKIQLVDDDWCIDLSMEKRPEQEGYIIATRPLTYEQWEKFEKGELIVFHNGKMIYSNNRDIANKVFR